MTRKADVDETYFRLAARLLDRTAHDGGPAVHLATHDDRLIGRLRAFIIERGFRLRHQNLQCCVGAYSSVRTLC
jgi:hypothetical protein